MPEKDCLNVDEAAEFLRISRAKLFELIGSKSIPFFRMGRDPKFCRYTLINWMDMLSWQTLAKGDEERTTRERNVAQVVSELREMRQRGFVI
jgi:excisionase family DNA binding protein